MTGNTGNAAGTGKICRKRRTGWLEQFRKAVEPEALRLAAEAPRDPETRERNGLWAASVMELEKANRQSNEKPEQPEDVRAAKLLIRYMRIYRERRQALSRLLRQAAKRHPCMAERQLMEIEEVSAIYDRAKTDYENMQAAAEALRAVCGQEEQG